MKKKKKKKKGSVEKNGVLQKTTKVGEFIFLYSYIPKYKLKS